MPGVAREQSRLIYANKDIEGVRHFLHTHWGHFLHWGNPEPYKPLTVVLKRRYF